MNEEDAVYMYNGILLSHEKERNPDICNNMDQRVPTCRWKMNKLWGSNCDCSQQYCIVYLEVAKRLGLKCSHHGKGMIIM